MDMKANDSTSTKETTEEKKSKLDRLQQRINHLEKQKRAIEVRENDKKRRARTRRLIQIGAIAVKYLECESDIEPEEFEKRIKRLVDGIEKKI